MKNYTTSIWSNHAPSVTYQWQRKDGDETITCHSGDRYSQWTGNRCILFRWRRETCTEFERGATYTFDQSDSSNSTWFNHHPLMFSTTEDGDHNR